MKFADIDIVENNRERKMCNEFPYKFIMQGDVMIRHICMFTLKEDNKEESIAEFFKRAEGLRKIDVIKGFNVVRNAEKTPASNYDVALIFDFDTTETLEIYQKSQPHVEFGEFVRSIRVQRACIDYEI